MTDLEWPAEPSGVLIMGKCQRTHREHLQLMGRIAMAAALWYSAPAPKPFLIFVASDVHGPDHRPDAALVRDTLTMQFGILGDFLILRQISNCTMVEVRAAHVLQKTYNLTHIFALTHLYHAPRTQRYFSEVTPQASVIPVHPAVLQEIVFPLDMADLYNEIAEMVAASQPQGFNLLFELFVESWLNILHTIDRRGRIERRLATLLRPRAARRKP